MSTGMWQPWQPGWSITTVQLFDSYGQPLNMNNASRDCHQAQHLLAELYAQPAFLQAYTSSKRRISAVLPRSQAHALHRNPAPPCHVASINIGHLQMQRLVARSHLCVVLTQRLLFDDQCMLMHPLNLATRIMSRRHVFDWPPATSRAPTTTSIFNPEGPAFMQVYPCVALHPLFFSFALSDSARDVQLDLGVANDAITFFANFLHILCSQNWGQDKAYSRLQLTRDSAAQPPAHNDAGIEALSPPPLQPFLHRPFLSLISACVHRIRLRELDSDSIQTILKLRSGSVARVIQDSAFAVGGDAAMAAIWPALMKAIETPAALPWQQVESLLFVATCVVQCVDDAFGPFIIALCNSLLAVASTNVYCASALFDLFTHNYNNVIRRIAASDFAASAPSACVTSIFQFVQHTIKTDFYALGDALQLQRRASEVLLCLAHHCSSHLVHLTDTKLLADQATRLSSHHAFHNFIGACYHIADALPDDARLQSLVPVCRANVFKMRQLLEVLGDGGSESSKEAGVTGNMSTTKQFWNAFVRLNTFHENLFCEPLLHKDDSGEGSVVLECVESVLQRCVDNVVRDHVETEVFTQCVECLWPVLRDMLLHCARNKLTDLAEEVSKALKLWLRSSGHVFDLIFPDLCQILLEVRPLPPLLPLFPQATCFFPYMCRVVTFAFGDSAFGSLEHRAACLCGCRAVYSATTPSFWSMRLRLTRCNQRSHP